MASGFCRKILLLNVLVRKVSVQKSQYRLILSSTKPYEVGRSETPKLEGVYDTGQVFVHRIFGYRGVVLFPWIAKVYDNDVKPKNDSVPAAQPEVHTYYQILMDERDASQNVPTPCVTFLSTQENESNLIHIPFVNYVDHVDIHPYTSTEKRPIHNHLFDAFLKKQTDSDSCVATNTMLDWQKKNHPWLELTKVYKETTENIRVTVAPFYIGSVEVQQTNRYYWQYLIWIENLGEETVQLRERHWRIMSLNGEIETIKGKRVVGKEPVLSKSQPSFQYSSHTSLYVPSGHMWGTFTMERNGSYFDVRIPGFALESKEDDGGISPHGFRV